MAAVNSRVQFLITAVDQTRAAFASAQRSMNSLRASVVGLKRLTGFGVFGVTAASLVRDFVNVSRQTPAVSQAIDNMTASYRELQRTLLDGGGSDAIVDFANTASRAFRGNTSALREFQATAASTREAMDNLGLGGGMLARAFGEVSQMAENTTREIENIGNAWRWLMDKMSFDKKLLGDGVTFLQKGDALGPTARGAAASAGLMSNDAAKADRLATATERFEGATTRAARSLRPMASGLQEVAARVHPLETAFLNFSSQVTDGLLSWAQGTQKASEAFRNMANDILSQITRLALNKLFMSFAGAFFGGGGGPTNIIPGFGSGGSPVTGPFNNTPLGFAGVYAKGGKIPAGMFGITGENGPEFVTGPATVVPSRGGGGGTKVVINNYSGAPVKQTKRRQGDVDVVEIVVGTIKKAIGDGRFDGVMGQKFGMRPQLTSR